MAIQSPTIKPKILKIVQDKEFEGMRCIGDDLIIFLDDLVSTLWDDIVFELINYYGLDINFILFNKEYTAYMSRDNTN